MTDQSNSLFSNSAAPPDSSDSAAEPEGAANVKSVPWARQSVKSDAGPVTDRVRRMVHGLPAWDPLPPGEILVVRSNRH